MSTAIQAAPLDVVATQSGVEPEGAIALKNAFSPFLAQAEEWRVKVAAVTDPKVARASRLVLKGIRVEADKTRKTLKEDSLRRGKAIDGMFNVIEFIVAPLEKQLFDIETAAERAEAARRAALNADRQNALAAYGLQLTGLDSLTDDAFAHLLETTKAGHEAKIEAARKAEEARIAAEVELARVRAQKEEEARAERERLLAETVRLRAEAAAKEAAAKIERERIEKERAAAESKARAEREASERKLRAEKAAREKLEAEARVVREREAARQEAEAKEAARIAAAPDKEKLNAFAALIETIEAPEMSTPKGKEAAAEAIRRVLSVAQWCRNAGGAL